LKSLQAPTQARCAVVVFANRDVIIADSLMIILGKASANLTQPRC
jgi:hypothetical protein